MSVLLEFSMTPLDKGESVSPYVARSLDIIDQSGLPYKLGPMGTCIEGEWDEVMAVVKACKERMEQECNRITISVKMDVRKGREGRLTGKIKSVEKRLGRSVKS
ncbi:MAG: MTH1187 family thiamine-binding protein [Magnetococcales bacterium]|nr:MTH1187 family thiamine-binding protein [Magnetococcales bacterium]